MQFLAGLPDAFGENRFYIHVDIFALDGKFHLAGFDIRKDLLEGLDDQLRFFHADDALFAEHLGVGYAARDVFCVKPLVETDGSIEFITRRTRLL